MTSKDIITFLLNKINNGEKISVTDLDEIVNTISVKDTVAGKDAVTVFYSGEYKCL